MRILLRRWFPCAALALLALPLLANLLLPAPPMVSEREMRRLATAPDWQALRHDIAGWTRKMDAYAGDHFGLRERLIGLNASLLPPELRTAQRATLAGSDGWLFLLTENTIEQSRGDVRRLSDLNRTAALIGRVNQRLREKNIRFLVASPPNASTIYQDKLPDWARNPGQPTEYDLLLDRLAALGVHAIDLRPALLAARGEGDVYFRQDTHWAPLGMVAAFNLIAAAAGHADWAFNAETVLGPAALRPNGDLWRMAGDDTRPIEAVRPLTLPMPERERVGRNNSYVTKPSAIVGTRLLIIGDSFTDALMLPLEAARAAQVAWTFHRHCGFDWSMIDRFKPDEVWMMPTERQILCEPDTTPQGMP